MKIEDTNTRFWRDAINKDIMKVKVEWKEKDIILPEDIRSGNVSDIKGCQEIKCHIVFDMKMNLASKDRFVSGSHTTETPSSMTYESVPG